MSISLDGKLYRRQIYRYLRTFLMASEKTFAKTLERIAHNVLRIRQKKKLSQSQVADLGFDLRHYQRIERGQASPTLYTLQKLADQFEVDIIEFLKPVKKN